MSCAKCTCSDCQTRESWTCALYGGNEICGVCCVFDVTCGMSGPEGVTEEELIAICKKCGRGSIEEE